MFENVKDDLLKIYSMIPDFNCKHCHKCCNNIIWFEPENILIREFIKKKFININHLKNIDFNKNNKCPFLNNSGCIIYPVRPIVCRFQGNIKELKCECNIDRKNKFINNKKLNQIKKEFIDLLMKTNGLDYFYSSRNIDKRFFYDNGCWK